MRNVAALTFALTLLTGCANQSFTLSGGSESVPTQDKSHHFFINGLGQAKAVDAARVCGGAANVAKVEVQETFVNGVLRVATFGIYTPREARVFCKRNS